MAARSESASLARYNEVRKVTIIGSVLDFVLGVAKILVGWFAQSQALIADGVHSLSDLGTDFIVLYAASHSHKAADEDHPYGHGRIETLATVGLGLALVVVATGIAFDAVERMNAPALLLEPGMIALAVAVVSVFSKEGIYRYTVRAARRLRSDMLRANAWHSRSDAISSIVVVIGVAGAMAGYPYLDAVAAIVVAVMIAKIGFDLVRSSTMELIDTALEPEQIEAIRNEIFSVPGVRAVHMLRTRKSGGDALIDVHIQVDPRISVSEGHQIGEAVRQRLMERIEEVNDVTVHIDPEDDEAGSPSMDLPLREEVLNHLRQRWQAITGDGVDLNDVTLHYLNGRLHVELVLPLSVLEGAADVGELVRQIKEAAADQVEIGEIEVRFRP